MRRRTGNIILSRGAADHLPSAEEIVLRPELCKEMLKTISSKVDDLDLEHLVVVGLTTKGAPILFHSYGRELPMADVADMLTDLAKVARAQGKR